MGRISRSEVRVELQIGIQERSRLIQRVLVQQQRRAAGIHQHRRAFGVVLGGHLRAEVVAVPRQIDGPPQVVSGQHPRPHQPLDAGIHPVHEQVVLVFGLPGRVELLGQRRIAGSGLVEPVPDLDLRFGEQRGVVSRQISERRDTIPKLDCDVLRSRLLQDVYDLIPEMFATRTIGIGVAQDFHEHTALPIVGQDLRGGPLEPQCASLIQRAFAFIRGVGDLRSRRIGHIHPLGHLIVINNPDVGDAVAGHIHGLAHLGEITLGPINHTGRLREGPRDQHLLLEGGIPQAGFLISGAHRLGRKPRDPPPGDGDGTGLGGEDHPRIRAPVVGRSGVLVGGIGFRAPIVFLPDGRVARRQQDPVLVGVGHRNDGTEQVIDAPTHDRAAHPGAEQDVGGGAAAQARQVQSDGVARQAQVGAQL